MLDVGVANELRYVVGVEMELWHAIEAKMEVVVMFFGEVIVMVVTILYYLEVDARMGYFLEGVVDM